MKRTRCQAIQIRLSYRVSAALLVLAALVVGALPGRAKITVTSYHLRDRAVITDSLLMRKRMIFGFKSSLPLAAVKKCAAAGTLETGGKIIAVDTTWLFDQAAGNLGFCLPYDIPDGSYTLHIEIVDRAGKVLDSFSDSYERRDLKAYFNREVNFWDFTTPFAHLECSGFGRLTYRFTSESAFQVSAAVLSARMSSDNNHPATVHLLLGDTDLGRVQLPSAENDKPPVVTWKPERSGAEIVRGENRLTIALDEADNGSGGMGIRIYAKKNVEDKAVGEPMPLLLELTPTGGGTPVKIEIPVWGEDGENITSRFNRPTSGQFLAEARPEGRQGPALTAEEIDRGYVLFGRHWQHYVYPWTAPADSERTEALHAVMGRHDFEPLTFSLYPLRDLGLVRVVPGDLAGPGGERISASCIRVHVVRPVKMRTGRGSGYRLIPRLLERLDKQVVPIDYTTRFWLTVATDSTQAAGTYSGNVTLAIEHAPKLKLPVTVDVVPVMLEAVPDIEYSMFMTYEFFELESKDLSLEQKRKVYADGVAGFRDYLDHGMTTVDVSSPYYFQWNSDGSPRLEHLKAMLRAAKETGYTRPIYWYFAHYLQAAKSTHPGNVLLFDPKVHPARARLLATKALELDREIGAPPLYFVPIDEPRIAKRKQITLELLRALKKIPGITIMSSTDIGGKLLDIENNASSFRKRLAPGEAVRKSERKVWEYHNSAIQCFNPGYSRYLYGYYTWRQDLDGMNSWGFNTAENSRGNPYEDLDHTYNDWNLAYPHPGGPLPTPNWEAVREGIDDVRFVYQLEKLIDEKSSGHGELAGQARDFLAELRSKCDIDEGRMAYEEGSWTAAEFDSLRSRTIAWILKLQSL